MRHGSSHQDYKSDLHMPWRFRHEAYVWESKKPITLNFYPAASQLSDWMQQQGPLSLLSEKQRNLPNSLTNPYSYHLSTISIIVGEIVNASHDYCERTTDDDPTRVEIERIRIHNEMILYFARFYEASIKQLLFLTTFSTRRYKDSALGALLAVDCHLCRKAGDPHGVSLLGSLAHKYHLCGGIDKCAIPTIRTFNHQRNVQSAHATTQIINLRTARESREQLRIDSYEQGTSFLHSLTHIGEIERAIKEDLTLKSLLIST